MWGKNRPLRRSMLSVSVFVVFLVMPGAAAAEPVPTNISVESGAMSPAAIQLPTWASAYDWLTAHGYNLWAPSKQTSVPQGYELRLGYSELPGLWLWPVGSTGPNKFEYPRGYAEFRFRAPGTTRIARASLDVSYRQNLYASHCTRIALEVQSQERMTDARCVVPESDQIDVTKDSSVASRTVELWDPAGAPTATDLFARIEIPNCASRPAKSCSKTVPVLDPLTNGPFLRVESVDMTLVDDDLPVVTPSGPFYELDGKYIDGRKSYALDTASSDAGAGITITQVDHTAPAPPYAMKTLGSEPAVCDPTHNTPALESRICPASDFLPLVVDTNPMPEGTNRFRAWAQDPAGNVGNEFWTVIIDRTPPPAPPNIRFLTSDEGSGQGAWDESVDPVLSDGTPGSGTTHYRYRSRVNGGAWPDWSEIDTPRQITSEVYDQPAGTHVEFEVVAVDLVGNVSTPSYTNGFVYGASPALDLAGSAAQADGGYVGGNEQLGLSATATDQFMAGVKNVALEAVGVGPVGSADAPCVNGAHQFALGKLDCPTSFTASFNVNTAILPEGVRTLRVATTDRAHNSAADTLTLLVDRTPPAEPDTFEVAFDSDSLDAHVNWEQADDPMLADGTPGSDVSYTVYRYKVADQDWSGWETTEDTEFEAPAHDQDLLRVEAYAVDNVGNASGTYHEILRVDDDPASSAEVSVVVSDRVGTSSHVLNVPGARVWFSRRDVFGNLKRLKRTTNLLGVARFAKVNAVPGSNVWTSRAFYRNDPMPTEYPTFSVSHGGKYQFGAGAIYDFDGNDCKTGRSRAKCGKFNVSRAVDYARDYAFVYNPNFPEVTGTDCTNFLNQILLAGGLTFSGEYARPDADEDNSIQSRWYKFGNRASECWKDGDCTISWIRVQAFVSHLRDRGLVTRVKTGNKNTKITNAKRGDFVVFDWQEKHGMDHAVFVTSVNGSGAPNVTAHTNNHKDFPWSDMVQAANNQAQGHNDFKDDWTFDMYRIKGPVRFNE